MKRQLIYCALIVFAFLGCKSQPKTADKKTEASDVGTYFSIKQFAMDEWTTYSGTPVTMTKTVKENGKTDTSYTNGDTLNWAAIMTVFFETDIGEPKFLGKYDFSQFDDYSDGTHCFFYQSKNDDVFTKKLLITIDNETKKITGIYIEASKSNFWSTVTEKLFYAPMKTIQIQTYTNPLIGPKKEKVVQYNFMM